MTKKWSFLWIIVLIQIVLCSGRDCGDGNRFAGQSIIPRTNDTDTSQDRIYFLTVKGGINCYGKVIAWRFYRNASICEPIQFQIWRGSNSPYTLVGTNSFTTSDCANDAVSEDIFFPIPKHEQISVQPDDFIGWKQLSDVGMIQFDDTSTPFMKYADSCPSPPGSTCTVATDELERDYSIGVLLKKVAAPVIDNLPNAIEINEDTTAPTAVYTVIGHHPGNFGGTVMPNIVPLTYSLQPDTDFTIDAASGVISVVSALDYDTTQEYNLEVTLKGHEMKVSQNITIRIKNVNRPHSITNLEATVYLSTQTARAGDQIFKVEVIDPDVLVSTAKTFLIESFTPISDKYPPFNMDTQTGIISCTQDLHDWIGDTTIDLSIKVLDDLHVAGPLNLTVVINDPNDPPTITNLPASVNVSENITGGADLFHVGVLTPNNVGVTFRIDNVDPANGTDNFEIDQSNGIIKVSNKQNFDFFQCPIYNLSIIVTDEFGQDGDIEQLTVNITWVNHPPTFTPHYYSVEIDEGYYSPPFGNSERIATLNVYDRDFGNWLTERLNCTILPGLGSGLFDASVSGNEVWVDQDIDVDSDPQYMQINLTIKVIDSGGLSDVATVYVKVNNINDNWPVFNPLTYSGRVKENTPGGTSILTVTATDKDLGVFGEIAYSANNRYFQVDAVTGVVYTKWPVDYENRNSKYESFLVEVKDGGTPPNIGITNVKIDIEDVNDNHPVIDCSNKDESGYYKPEEECFYNLDFSSNTSVGYQIMERSASDMDIVSNNLTFFFLKPEEYFKLEYIDRYTARVSVSKKMESYGAYSLYIYARDNGEPELISGPAVVRIDSFLNYDHLVDVTILKTASITIPELLIGLRKLLHPWFIRNASETSHPDKTVVAIYALSDNSTFHLENLSKKKVFIHRNDLWWKLRENIHGDPNEGLKNISGGIVKVYPTYPNWWVDTIPGLITTGSLSFILLILLLILLLLLCKRFELLCFKKKLPQKHNWPSPGDKAPLNISEETEEPPIKKTRRPSVDTVHSLIYPKDEDPLSYKIPPLTKVDT